MQRPQAMADPATIVRPTELRREGVTDGAGGQSSEKFPLPPEFQTAPCPGIMARRDQDFVRIEPPPCRRVHGTPAGRMPARLIREWIIGRSSDFILEIIARSSCIGIGAKPPAAAKADLLNTRLAQVSFHALLYPSGEIPTKLEVEKVAFQSFAPKQSWRQ